MLNSIHATS